MILGQQHSQTELERLAVECYADPYRWVMLAYPWRKAGTPLENFDGPDEWQREYLVSWGQEIAERNFDGHTAVPPIRKTRSSGHGIGKSALVAWICQFMMVTRPFCRGVITANTSIQLESKTWAEMAKWLDMCQWGHWFDITSSKGNLKLVHVAYPKNWRVDGQTCREENSEAFAGLHAATSSAFYIFDEASAVPDRIWEVAEGGMTDGEPHFHSFGNPTRNTGKFHRINFGRERDAWDHKSIDSRTVSRTNKELFEEWRELHGEDSDFFRVRVRGLPPRASELQFIPMDYVDDAQGRELVRDSGAAKIMGVDVARFGDDASVITFRQGNDARTTPPALYRGMDLMQYAAVVAGHIDDWKPDAVHVDGVGLGAGLVDRLRQMGYQVVDVNSGGRPSNPKQYRNLRAEMWGKMRDWLRDTGCIIDDDDLRSDLTGIDMFWMDSGAIALESKESMKKRGLASPDRGDSLALTFAQPVQRRDMNRTANAPIQAVPDFSVF